jgi:geranylgeranyl pyrophosphate synthase
VARSLERFGTSFGIAFQVADDLLDFLGDERTTGKPLGTDLKEGVYTLPLLHGLGERAELADIVRVDGNLSGVVEILQETGSFGYARSVAERYASEAREALDGLPDRPEKETLEGLIDFVVDRMPVSPAA